MGTQLKGDFIGFSFDGKHSSDLGIVRTSNGSRYDDNLLPTSQDKTAAVPGGDGTYYWDTSHTQKQFNIPIAFDDLTEEQYRRLRQVFNTKNLGKLIFDEAPYKYYMAKPTGTPQLKTICFDEEGGRVYKGEGTIQFTAYYPYAKSVHKWLDEYSDDEYPNKNEWATASGMLNNANETGDSNSSYDSAGGNAIKLYNSGDMETDFCLYFDFGEANSIELKSLQIIDKGSIHFKTFEKQEEDNGFRINTKTNLIEGFIYKEENDKTITEITGTLYNKCIESGDFFKIPVGEFELKLEGATASKIEYEYIYY